MIPDGDPGLPASGPRSGAAEDAPAVEMARLREANRQLAQRIAMLTELARTRDESARLQAERAASLLGWAARNEGALQGLYGSTFWQLSAPLRVLARLIGGTPVSPTGTGLIRRALALAAEGGWRAAFWKSVAVARRISGTTARRVGSRFRRSGARSGDAASVYEEPISRPASAVLGPSVLIVAELSVPQCAKYRVWQKQELIERLGIPCRITDWHDPAASRAALQLCSLAIFYRVPGTPEMLDLIAEARRLGVPSWWEVDDVIFDEPIYRANGNLGTLDAALRENLLDGVRLYRRGMLACDKAIASTDHLAAAMRQAGVPGTLVIENALDTETLDAAASLRVRRAARATTGDVLIVYGSGTKTHDVDFALAAPALIRLMHGRPGIRLRIVGELALPPEIDAFGARVERFDAKDYRTWLGLLSEADIALAPLEDTIFNDAKSNIKFLEAAVLGIPSVCSPRANFRAAIVDGETGLLAEEEPAWFEALGRLADDAGLRRRIGEAALHSVLARYSPEPVARGQVSKLVAGLDRRPPPGLRILVANIFFWPRSFGGATIVAEEMASRLNARDDAEVYVFTSHMTPVHGEYGLRRYERDGMPIISVGLPAIPDEIAAFDNPLVAQHFAAVLRAVRPDVVHVHSIQGIGASILSACREQGVPYVVTVHDAWWLCPRQFMVRGDGRYCFQTRIDLNLCRACVPGASYLPQRLNLLIGGLRGAARILSPSHSHAALYAANGIDPDRLLVQPNGTRVPARPRVRRSGRVLRFGYVGGAETVKGFPQLRAAFEALARSNWELVLIDNTLNLGFASIDVRDWRHSGKVVTEPAYGQEELDTFFDSIDVLLFPSQWKESFGLTVREALARDVWVIATDCGGPAEAIADGVNGTLLPMDGRHDKLRDAIAALLDAPERLDGYRNPHKEQLTTFDSQAEALFSVLRDASDALTPLPAETCAGGFAPGLATPRPYHGSIADTA